MMFYRVELYLDVLQTQNTRERMEAVLLAMNTDMFEKVLNLSIGCAKSLLKPQHIFIQAMLFDFILVGLDRNIVWKTWDFYAMPRCAFSSRWR